MKFGVWFANVGPFARSGPFTRLCVAAERLGFESLWTVEHVVIPVGYQASYPYDASGRIPIPENCALPDPLLPLAFAAAKTSRIKLATGVLILPQRHPFYIAKEAATLDVLSDGRFILGVGVGWLEDEFNALGIPFAERGARTDETIRAMRSLWHPTPQPFASRYFEWGPVEMNPKPVQIGGVPIVIGGHSAAAARRAARLAQGFFPMVSGPAELAPLTAEIERECARIGRDPAEVEITTFLAGDDPAEVERWAAVGVSRLLTGYGLGGRGDGSEIDDLLERFAERVLRT